MYRIYTLILFVSESRIGTFPCVEKGRDWVGVGVGGTAWACVVMDPGPAAQLSVQAGVQWMTG